MSLIGSNNQWNKGPWPGIFNASPFFGDIAHVNCISYLYTTKTCFANFYYFNAAFDLNLACWYFFIWSDLLFDPCFSQRDLLSLFKKVIAQNGGFKRGKQRDIFLGHYNITAKHRITIKLYLPTRVFPLFNFKNVFFHNVCWFAIYNRI